MPERFRTTARRDGAEYVINGSKQWITSGDRAGVIIVWARTGEPGTRGNQRLSRRRRQQGSPCGQARGQDGPARVQHRLPGFRGPAGSRERHAGAAGPRLSKSRWARWIPGASGSPARAIGIGTAALDAAIRYAKDRRAFGQPIANNQAIRFMLADAATGLEAARLLTLRAPRRRRRGSRSLEKGRWRRSSPRRGEQSLRRGGAGPRRVRVHRRVPVERHYRDVRITTIYEGSSEIQRMVVARHLLADRRGQRRWLGAYD